MKRELVFTNEEGILEVGVTYHYGHGKCHVIEDGYPKFMFVGYILFLFGILLVIFWLSQRLPLPGREMVATMLIIASFMTICSGLFLYLREREVIKCLKAGLALLYRMERGRIVVIKENGDEVEYHPDKLPSDAGTVSSVHDTLTLRCHGEPTICVRTRLLRPVSCLNNEHNHPDRLFKASQELR